jgi:hypothetical protein
MLKGSFSPVVAGKIEDNEVAFALSQSVIFDPCL